MNVITRLFRSTRRAVRESGGIRRGLLRQVPTVRHVGHRSYCIEGGRGRIKKVFSDTEDALECMQREVLARELFGDRPWMTPILEVGERHLVFPSYATKSRLDVAAGKLGARQREEIAVEAIGIAFELFEHGFAHRDFHSKNLFLVGSGLRLIDFEVLEPYPATTRQPFPESYDLVGRGLPSPLNTQHACYTSVHNAALERVLRTPLDVALAGFQAKLKDELRDACRTFEKAGSRHVCRSERIYNSIDLPYFKVDRSEAQRDSHRRLTRFGVVDSDVRNRRVLDLGCNIGGMLFALQQFHPLCAVGVEYDAQKVRAARRVAAFNGITELEFINRDIDLLAADEVQGPFDLVCCLAVEAHVKDLSHLYELLGAVTSNMLLFEGNSSTVVDDVNHRLREVGFQAVTYLGSCDDDVVESNNNRPLFVARK